MTGYVRPVTISRSVVVGRSSLVDGLTRSTNAFPLRKVSVVSLKFFFYLNHSRILNEIDLSH